MMFDIECCKELLSRVIVRRENTPQCLGGFKIHVEFLCNHAWDPGEFGDCLCEVFLRFKGVAELMVSDGAGKGNVWPVEKLFVQGWVLEECEESRGLARFEAEVVEEEGDFVGVAEGVEREEEEPEFGGGAPGSALREVLDVAPDGEVEVAVFWAAEGEARFAGGKVGAEGGVEGAAHGEEGAFEEVAGNVVVALVVEDFAALEEGCDMVGIVMGEMNDALGICEC